MNPRMTRCAASAAVIFAFCAGSAAQPLTDAFTYQGYLTESGVPADGLRDVRVRVIDETGAMLARPEDEESGMEGAFEHQTSLEKTMEKRIVKLLEPLVGVGGVRAQVSARMDFSRILETEEKFDPDSQVARSEREQTEENNSETAPSEGAPGVVNNVPERVGGAAAMSKTSTNNRADRVVNYELDRVTKRRESPTPRLEKISIAVVVDGARELTEDGDLKVRPRSAEEVEQYRSIVIRNSYYWLI